MVIGPMVWGISPELAGSGLGALTYALRHVGRVGRPVGGSGMVPSTLRRAFEAAGGALLLDTKVAQPSPARARRPRHDLHRRHRGHRTDRGLGLQPARHVPAWLSNPPPQATADGRAVAGDPPRRRLRVEDRRRCSIARRRLRGRATASASTDGDRAHRSPRCTAATRLMAAGKVLERPGPVRQRRHRSLDATLAPGGPARAQPGGAVHAVRLARRLGRQRRAARAGSTCSPTVAGPRASSSRSSTGGR